MTLIGLNVEGPCLLEICPSVPWGLSWGTHGSIRPSPIAWSYLASSHTLLLELGEEDELLTWVHGPLSRTPGTSCVLVQSFGGFER